MKRLAGKHQFSLIAIFTEIFIKAANRGMKTSLSNLIY